MSEKLYQEVKKLVSEIIEMPEEEFEGDTRFVDDLGIDSILIIEMKTIFEEKYGVEIGKDELEQFNCLDAIVNYLAAKNEV